MTDEQDLLPLPRSLAGCENKIAELRDSVPVAEFSARLELKAVPVKALRIDPRYQRRVSENGRAKILRIMRDFSWARFGALTVAATRDGSFALVDGQHRAIAAQLMGVDEVPAVILKANLRAQAEDFVGVNTVRSGITVTDRFRARVTAGDPAACNVAKLLADLEISTDVPPGGLLGVRQTRAVTILEKLAKNPGEATLYLAVSTMLSAQPETRNLLTTFAIEVTTRSLHQIGDGFDSERFRSVVAETDYERLKRDAQELVKLTGGKVAVRGIEMMVRDYRKPRRGAA